MSSLAGRSRSRSRRQYGHANTFHSLDDESGAIVEDLLQSSFKGWTVIAVAHKLKSIIDFDRVAVLDAGKIVECGAPRDLLQLETSAFKTMYNASPTK